jgi:hypothetical protein
VNEEAEGAAGGSPDQQAAQQRRQPWHARQQDTDQQAGKRAEPGAEGDPEQDGPTA